MQQIDAAAVFTDQNHADCQTAQVKGGKVGIFLQRCKTARQTRQQRHQQACRKPADAHCRQTQPGKHIADCRTGQDGMTQSIAHQAHAPHDQEHADRSGTQSQTEYRRKRIAHKVEFRKRGNQQIV